MKRRVNLLASALAAGAMVAGMMPAPTSAAESAQKQTVAVVEEKKERKRRRETHRKGKTRRERIEELESREMQLSRESRAELAHLRSLETLSRGKAGRRMARRRWFGIGRTVRALKLYGSRTSGTPPMHLGARIPRAVRAVLLREEGRPVSGRQWTKLRKAARRQERAS